MTARVLVVDDVDANVKLLEARLTADYFEVRTARSGREALEICANERADVVLLDVMMPGMDGFEVCRRLKAETRTQHIPVILVTALDQPADRVKGFEAGADDFLTKPVDDVALVKRVRNLARLKMLTDEMVMRASTEEQLGFAYALHKPFDQVARGGRILLVEDNDGSYRRILEAMPDCDLAKAYQVGERLRQCIAAAPFEVGGKVGLLQVTASVGVAALEFDDDAPELMLKRADQALYCAKRDGRNRVVADAA
jgi:PleD family two-component response regulator